MKSEFRFVHIGIAGLLVAATITAISGMSSVGAAGSGTASSFVPIVPCRLADTRSGSDNVGIRARPVGPAEVITLAVWGSNGNCTIPASATGVATNVTATNATAASYITVYPADANPRPTASNLNVFAGSAPTPNQVTVGLSSAGAIAAYNLSGDVDIIVDIVGYYQPETVAGATAGPIGPTGPQGLTGPPGPKGDNGNADSDSIYGIYTVNTRPTGTIPAAASTYQFFGNPQYIVTRGLTLRATASAMVPISSASNLAIRLDFCYQFGSGVVYNFAGFNYSTVELVAGRQVAHAVAANLNLPSGGSIGVQIGVCLLTSQAITSYGTANGWIMLTS